MPDSIKKKDSDVVFDLDTLERDDAAPPFLITLGGGEYTLTDPAELPWKTLNGLRSDSNEFLSIAVDKGKRRAFSEALDELPAWKVRALVNAYMAHHGMPRVPE